MLTTRSTVIARAGTLYLLRTPSCLIVRPAFEIPYSARPASAVDAAIDSSRLVITKTASAPGEVRCSRGRVERAHGAGSALCRTAGRR